MNQSAVEQARRTLEAKSRSFALAARLLRKADRDAMAVLYAYCRHADDAIDLAPVAARPQALARLHADLEDVYGEGSLEGGLLRALRDLVRERSIPRVYFDELLAGMGMDVARVRYRTLADLELYCFRVAGVVGLMACHVLGVRDPDALRNAAHLGIAMQLTNICRDVEEDAADGRVYLPDELLGGPLTLHALSGRQSVRSAVARLLEEADRYYRSGDRGLRSLSLPASVAIRVARLVYAAIGGALRRRGCDPFLGRAVVGRWRKAALVVRAIAWSLVELPRRLVSRRKLVIPQKALGFPHDILPA